MSADLDLCQSVVDRLDREQLELRLRLHEQVLELLNHPQADQLLFELRRRTPPESRGLLETIIQEARP